MRIKGIKIDEDVAKILNEQDKDDTSKYRVYYTNESINEDYEEDDCEDVPEEMHKERYVTYFETQEGRQRYTIYHVYTDSTDDSYNELCDKRDNQLGMYDSYKELRDALKERAEKIAEQRGWTVKSIENLGEDDEYYRERNKWESIKEGFNIGDKVQLKRKNNKIGIVKSIFKGDKDKNGKDIKYLDVEFEDGTKEGRPASDFKKVNESINEDYEWHGPVAKVTFDNGDVIETAINGTDEEIKSYYMGKTFNLGKEEDDMHKAVKVEVIRESMKEGFNKEANDFPEGSFAAWYGKDLSGRTYEGDLDCSYYRLTSLFGCPSVVTGNFNCSHNQLTSLEGAPQEVKWSFYCSDNRLTSLEGAPKEVDGIFDCENNNLTSLKGAPEKVGEGFDCSLNELTSLEGAPEKVGGFFDCSYNKLTSLEGSPKEVGEVFDCTNNNLTSLKGAPKEVEYWFDCSNNPNLKSLDGIGEVKGNIISDID